MFFSGRDPVEYKSPAAPLDYWKYWLILEHKIPKRLKLLLLLVYGVCNPDAIIMSYHSA